MCRCRIPSHAEIQIQASIEQSTDPINHPLSQYVLSLEYLVIQVYL